MSDESSADIVAARMAWLEQHRALYLESGGTQGHIVDMRDIGGHGFTTTLLLQTTGRRSGRRLVTPLIYGSVGGDVVIVASKGGADHHPDWYLNIREMQELEFQIATQAFRASWREPAGEERAMVWDFMVSVYPPYRDYQKATERLIPLVMLTPTAPTGPITG